MASIDSASSSRSVTVAAGSGVALDLLELWVRDIVWTRDLLTRTFGFEPLDFTVDADPDAQVACLASGQIAILLRQGNSPTSPIARHVAVHGDTVADVALVCRDPGAVAERAAAHGLHVTSEPGRSRIDVTGDGTIWHSIRPHRLVSAPASTLGTVTGPEMQAIDHVTYCLRSGTAEKVAGIYENVFDLRRIDIGDLEQVGGDARGMRSIVLRSDAGFTVVLTEPVRKGGSGQTQRFIDAHGGPGVQHAAIVYDDICASVESLRAMGVEFLRAPPQYYPQAEERLADASVPWDSIRRLEILVDADDDGLLFQLFTRPIGDRGTFFFELIQRSGASGFGVNNVRALFAAVDSATHEHHAGDDQVKA